MNYRKYFILAPGKATCRQENCPKQEVSRKQGNTSGMRFHLKKYHPDFLLEDSGAAAPGSSAADGLGLSLTSLVQSSHSPSNYFDSNNPNNEVGSSATANFYAYPTNDSGFSIPINSQNPQASTDYDVKAEIMDMLFNGSDQIDSNNHPSYFDEQKSEEPIPQKRRRNDAAPTSTNVYELNNPFDNNISYGFLQTEESLPSPSVPQYGLQGSTKKSRYQFTDADKTEIKNRIRKKELLLCPVSGSTDIMCFVVDGSERIAVYCTVCGGLLSAKGGGSITYHRNACAKLSDPARIQAHPICAEMKKKLKQKCLNLMTNNYFPAVNFNDEGFLDLLQYVHNLGFNFGLESARMAKEEISFGPGVLVEAMPQSSELQRIVEQTVLQYTPNLKEFIHQNIKDGGGALTVQSMDKYYNYLAYTFHFVTADWKLFSIPVSLKEYQHPPTASNIDEDVSALINEYNLSLNDITIVINEETESENRENYIKNASHFLISAIQWVLNSEDETFNGILDSGTISNIIDFVKLVETVCDVLEYVKCKPNISVKIESLQDDSFETDKLSFIKQFLEMSAKDFEAISWHLKEDQRLQLLLNFQHAKQRYQEFQSFYDLINPFLVDIKTLDLCDQPTLYMVPVLYESLMKSFNKFRNSSNKLIAGLSEACYLYLESVKQKLIIDSHYIALFLNPKLNGQIESLIKQEHLDKLLDKITVECNKIAVEKNEFEEPAPKKFSSLRMRQRMETTFQTELDEYLAVEISECDPSFNLLEWWKQNSTRFPRLSKIAKKYHSIPASCTSENGAFGILEKLNCEERIFATPEMLSKMIIYRSIVKCCF